MLIFPINIDVPMDRWPWMNWVLIGLMIICYGLQQLMPEEMIGFILMGPESLATNPKAIIGHMFIHANIWHIFGNLWVMWVFGNAACAKIGNLLYPLLFLGTGVATAFIEPYGLGASGAIYGLIGFVVVFYPLNDVSIFWLFLIRFSTFSTNCYWVILTYLAFDVFGLVGGGGAVAYLSHLCGCIIGAATTLLLLKIGFLETNKYERTVIDIIKGRHSPVAGDHGVALRADKKAPAADVRRLHVRIPTGGTKYIGVSEFIRHESQDKSVNGFVVSEDGEAWLTFGQWREKNGV